MTLILAGRGRAFPKDLRIRAVAGQIPYSTRVYDHGTMSCPGGIKSTTEYLSTVLVAVTTEAESHCTHDRQAYLKNLKATLT